MDIIDIRREVHALRPNAASIVAKCREALDDLPEALGEQAEILYHLAGWSYAADPCRAIAHVDEAFQASMLATRAGDYLLAVKAACLRISLLDVARTVRTTSVHTSSLVSDLAEIRQLLNDEWRSKMDPAQYVKAQREISWLDRMFARRAREQTS